MSEGPGAASNVVESRIGAGFQAMATGDWRGARDVFSAVLEVAEVPEAFTPAAVRATIEFFERL